MDVFIDKNAAESDGIILGCRIKPHTAFRGPYESGIMKMMAIGLGKQHGAEVCMKRASRIWPNTSPCSAVRSSKTPLFYLQSQPLKMRMTKHVRS